MIICTMFFACSLKEFINSAESGRYVEGVKFRPDFSHSVFYTYPFYMAVGLWL